MLDQRFDIDDLYQVRAAVAAHAAELGLASELANDVVIAVHELASNSVRHGPGYGRLRIWASDQDLTCEIADGGHILEPIETRSPEVISPPEAELPWPSEPGHGLWLVGKVADRLTVQCDKHGATATARFVMRP